MKPRKKRNYWYAVDEKIEHIQAHTPGQARRVLQQRYPAAAILQRSSEKYFLLQKQNSHVSTTHPF
jgi:hypothetical protein